MLPLYAGYTFRRRTLSRLAHLQSRATPTVSVPISMLKHVFTSWYLLLTSFGLCGAMDRESVWDFLTAHAHPESASNQPLPLSLPPARPPPPSSSSSSSSRSHSSQKTHKTGRTRLTERLSRVEEGSHSSQSTASSTETPRLVEGLTPSLTRASRSSSWPLHSWLSSSSGSKEHGNGRPLAELPSMGPRTQQRLRAATAQVLREDEPGHPRRPPSASLDVPKRPPSDL